MKLNNFTLLFIFLCIGSELFSQETKTVKRILSPALTETYSVLKEDKKIKDGDVTIIDAAKHLIVSGQYKNGKKDSVWIAVDGNGNLIQKYNYADSTLLQNDVDPTTNVQSNYRLPESASSDAQITPPVQVGGANYGFYLLYDSKEIPAQVLTITSKVVMTYAFELDKDGKLKACHVSYTGPGVDLTEEVPVKNKPDDLYHFLPAKVNNTPVESTLLYTVDINVNKSGLPDPYYAPTQGTSKMSDGIRH